MFVVSQALSLSHDRSWFKSCARGGGLLYDLGRFGRNRAWGHRALSTHLCLDNIIDNALLSLAIDVLSSVRADVDLRKNTRGACFEILSDEHIPGADEERSLALCEKDYCLNTRTFSCEWLP